MSSTFAITVPETTVQLAENRLGEMPFTITNTTDRPLRARAAIVPLDATPPQWFSVAGGKTELDLRPGASASVVVRVEPPLGVPPGTHLFRLDAVDVSVPAVPVGPAGPPGPAGPAGPFDPAGPVSVGPLVSVVVPPSQAKVNRWLTPRGYLATLVGATIGGAIGELIILLAFRAPAAQDCSDIGCAFGDALAQFFFLVFAVLFGLALLWIGAVAGTWVGLRIRRYLGAKTTALFLAVLMIPWTVAMLALLGWLNLGLTASISVAPILLTSLPAVIARGAVLLIRTKHL